MLWHTARERALERENARLRLDAAERERILQRRLDSLLNRVDTMQRVELRPGHPDLPSRTDDDSLYVSDLQYHDEVWDDFVVANEATEPTEDAQ